MENDFVGNTVTKMVGCVARLFKKDANSDEMLALADELFPAPCLAQYPGEPNAIVKKWFKTSADAAKAMASMSDTAVQKEFLAHLKTFQNYGYEVFFIHGTNDPQVGGELLLAIGQGGMRFIDMDKRTITETVQYGMECVVIICVH